MIEINSEDPIVLIWNSTIIRGRATHSWTDVPGTSAYLEVMIRETNADEFQGVTRAVFNTNRWILYREDDPELARELLTISMSGVGKLC